MNVVLTDEALEDLVRIGAFIKKGNPVRAVTFVAELENRCMALADLPYGFPLVPRHENTGIRRRPHGEYLIFYRVEAARIDVLHILNGAQDYEAILFPAD